MYQMKSLILNLNSLLSLSPKLQANASGEISKLSDIILTVSNKVFYYRSWGANPNGAFIEVSRPEAADPTAEFNAMHYIDVHKYILDWNISLNNLKRLGQDRLYTEDMMKTCLL
jgi:hypothetical protein